MSSDAADGVVRRVVAEIRRHGLVRAGDRVLVGVGLPSSLGGLATVALFVRAAEALGVAEVAVASIERGCELDDDAESVADVGRVARDLGLSFFAVRPQRRPDAAGVVDELRALAEQHGYQRVALGHTREDAAAAALSAFARGVGVTGAPGLRRRERGGVIRPLLGVDASSAAALSAAIAPATPPPERAKGSVDEAIRVAVLPRLRAVVPSADAGLASVARELRALRAVVLALARQRVAAARVAPKLWEFERAEGAWPAPVASLVAEVVLRAALGGASPQPASVRVLAALLRAAHRSGRRGEVARVLTGGVVARALDGGRLRVDARRR